MLQSGLVPAAPQRVLGQEPVEMPILVSGDTLYAAAGVPATFGGKPENNGLFAYQVDIGAAEPRMRVAGADGTGTAVAVSQATFTDAASVDTGVLASSEGFTDALAGTPLAAKMGGPLLLTPTGELVPATTAELQRLLTPGPTVHVVGGRAAVSGQMAEAIEAGPPAAGPPVFGADHEEREVGHPPSRGEPR